MHGPSLQDGLDRAGSAIRLLWKPDAPAEAVPVVPPEMAGWRQEQRAWQDGVALLNLSHHMADEFINGPDATRLLSFASANDYTRFAVGQAKQFIAVSSDGYLIQDGILVRLGDESYDLIGIGTAQSFVAYLAQEGGYDVRFELDPPSSFREGPPKLFRYQVQGPKAGAMLDRLFGDQLEGIRFFHFREVELEGRRFNALRHGMAGQAGFEFFGPWENADFVYQALLSAGAQDGIIEVGGLAYYSAGVDSGWLATPVPAVYTQDELAGFRKFTSLFSYEGQGALQGSFYSPDIADYYCSPYELGYGRSIAFNHDFFGREALSALKDNVRRRKVTLVWDPADVRRVFGDDQGFFLSYSKDRVERGSELVGISQYATYMDPDGTIHSLALVNTEHADPGTELTLVWGQHPGPDGDAEKASFEHIRATVAQAPYNEVARTSYRAD